MNNVTYYICAVVLLLMFLLYWLDRYNKMNKMLVDNESKL